MPDNTFVIGAAVNVQQLAEGMNGAVTITREALDEMLVDFSSASSRMKNAVAGISEETRQAALSVDSSFVRMAAASLEYRSALKEVRDATLLARAAAEGDAAAVNLLAAAKQRLTLATNELKAAEAAQAVTSEETAAIQVTAVAETAAAVEGLSGVFETLSSSFLGVGIGAGIFGHMVNEASTFAIQMRNLGLITGISANTLAGLHDVVKVMGGDFDSVSVGLSKMLKAQQDAVDGSTKQIEGFRMVGVSVSELKSLSPEQLLFRLAEGFQASGSSAQKNTAAIDIFGRGGRSLIPIFESSGAGLRDWVSEAAKVSGVTNQSVEASLKWEAVVEDVGIEMRNFGLEILPALNKAMAVFAAGSVAIGASIYSMFVQVREIFVSTMQEMTGFGKVMKDVVTGNFGAIVSDSKETAAEVRDTWTDGARDIQFAWKGVGEEYNKVAGAVKIPTIPKIPGGDDLPGEGNPKKDTRLEEWRSELQAMKDAEDGFHELSRADEAKFWESKLALAKGNSKLYSEVYHQMRDDERAAQKDSLKDEMESIKERVAGTKQGSVERVAIWQEEVGHLKSINATETSDYRESQKELTAAVQAYADEQARAVIEAERRKVEATRKGSEERIAAERAVLSELEAQQRQETSAYTEQLNRVTEAVRAASAERAQLQELDIEQARIVGQSKLQIERQNVQAEFDLHRINAQQRIAQFKQIEDEEYEIAKQAMEKKLGIEQGKGSDSSVVEQQKIQNQIENLTREHNNRIAQLNTESVKESQRAYDQFFSHVNTGFQSAINGWLTGTQTFARSMQQLWHTLVMDIINEVEKIALKWIEQHLLMAAYNAIFHTQQGAQDAAAATAQTAVHAATNVAMATSDAALAAAGTFAFYSAIFPPTAPAFAAAAFAEGMGFASLASAKGGMISGSEQLAFLHRDEMVLPAPLSQGFQHIIGNMGTPAAAGPGGGGSFSPDHSVNYSGDVHVNAFDAKGVGDMIRRNQREFTRAAAGIVRNGWRPK